MLLVDLFLFLTCYADIVIALIHLIATILKLLNIVQLSEFIIKFYRQFGACESKRGKLSK